MRLPIQIVLAIAVILFVAAVAEAANFCVNPGTTGDFASLAVGEAFVIPARNTCKPFNGFDLAATPSLRLVAGTACMSAAGHTLHVAYTVNIAGAASSAPYPAFVNMDLPYPSLSGGPSVVRVNDTSSSELHGAHANWCVPAAPTIP